MHSCESIVLFLAICCIIQFSSSFHQARIGGKRLSPLFAVPSKSNEVDEVKFEVSNFKVPLDADDKATLRLSVKNLTKSSIESFRWIEGPEKEESRKFRRTVYSFQDWENHRSQDRFFKNLVTMPTSRVIRSLWLEISSVVAVAVFIVAYNSWNADHNFMYPKLFMSPAPITLSSPILGLLLVFRTNNAYARWLDGRNAWGIVQSRLRSIVLETHMWLVDTNSNADVQSTALSSSSNAERDYYEDMIVRYSVAMALSLKCHLRYNEDEKFFTLMRPLVGDNAAIAAINSPHRPLWALKALGALTKQCSQRALFDDRSFALARIQEYIRDITAAIDTCERIKRNPLPLVYTRHLGRFLALWMLFLPLALYHEAPDSSIIPMSLLISALLFGVEVGVIDQ